MKKKVSYKDEPRFNIIKAFENSAKSSYSNTMISMIKTLGSSISKISSES